jgi:transposase
MENESPGMELQSQPALLPEMHLWLRPEPGKTEDQAPIRVKAVRRDQLVMRTVDVEQLVGPDHPARAIWELAGQCDLQPFYEMIQAVESKAGRPPHDPRLLISVWLYSYTQGIASGREIEKRCGYDPAYMWLTGAEKVCAHSLTDFRTAYGEALKDLSIQVLAVMAAEGLVDLQQVTQDGTKISASAGADTFRRRPTLEKHLQLARQRMEELIRAGDNETLSRRTLAAQQRAAQEKLQRMEKALQQIEVLEKKADEPEKVRVSTTDPDARVMQQNTGGYAPSYNTQFTTDAKKTVIVSVAVTQDHNDAGQLQPAMQRVQEEAGQAPQQVISDGSYTNRGNIVEMAQSHIDLIGPPPDSTAQKETLYRIRGVTEEFRPEAFAFDAEKNCYTCPAGKTLPYQRKNVLPGQTKYIYQAAQQDCQGCVHRPQCCPKSQSGRSVVRGEDSTEVKEFRAKMETEAAKAIYKKRGAVAEFPHLWIKEKFGMRRFSLRGLKKVNIEALWLTVTFNIQQWIRLCWRPRHLQVVFAVV